MGTLEFDFQSRPDVSSSSSAGSLDQSCRRAESREDGFGVTTCVSVGVVSAHGWFFGDGDLLVESRVEFGFGTERVFLTQIVGLEYMSSGKG